MANALDRVKAAEAKYTAMGETAEKLESTLKNFKGEADLCYATMRELHREIKFRAEEDRRPSAGLSGGSCWWSGRWPSPWPSLGIFYGTGLCALLMLWGLGGEAERHTNGTSPRRNPQRISRASTRQL